LGLCFEYFENDATLSAMPRITRNIAAATAPTVPEDGRDVERKALDMLADLEDDAFVEVQIKRPRRAQALFPVGFLRRYLAAQSVPGRKLLLFDSDEEVSSQVAADMLGVSRPHLNELLDVEAIPYRRIGNQRRIRVIDLHQFRQRRDRSAEGLGEMADIVNESAGGWTR
jgi:excisionase family DNA binding protein